MEYAKEWSAIMALKNSKPDIPAPLMDIIAAQTFSENAVKSYNKLLGQFSARIREIVESGGNSWEQITAWYLS